MESAGRGKLTSARVILAAGAKTGASTNGMMEQQAIHIAAQNGKPYALDLLVRFDADIEAKDGWGQTPLHGAAVSGNTEAIRVLLKLGADPSAKDSAGKTALQIAQEEGMEEAVKLLKLAEKKTRR